MNTTNNPAALWDQLRAHGQLVASAIQADCPTRPLRVVHHIIQHWEDVDEQAQFILGCFLILLRASTPHFGADLDHLTLQYHLRVSGMVEERLPTSTIVQAIRDNDTRGLFIEATRLAAFYMRNENESTASCLYGTAMALVLGGEERFREPGIQDLIRGWDLVNGQWQEPDWT